MTTLLDLRLIVITDDDLAAPRDSLDVVAAALAAGAPAVQLRDKAASSARLLERALRLRDLTRRHSAALFINDRLDIALAAGADGVHLGPHDVPVAAARSVAPPGFVIGYSTDSATAARNAIRLGADYIGCGAVFATRTKADVGDEAIGLEGLSRMCASIDAPVIAIGGIRPEDSRSIRRTGARGVAIAGAIMTAPDPGLAARAVLSAWPR